MRLVSVNVSMGREVSWNGRTVVTGIFKAPVPGRVRVMKTQVDGDRQADRTVHGGEHKAVYAYALEHYRWWAAQLGRDLPPGMFGENLTVEGLVDEQVCVGDLYQVGSTVLEAVQPRLPCFKLGLRFGDGQMVGSFARSGRWGIYFRVEQEGELGAGDAMTLLRRGEGAFPIPDLARLLLSKQRDPETVRRALALSSLPPSLAEVLA